MKNKIQKKVLFGVAAGIVVVAYIVVAIYYAGHFFPGTIINGISFDNAGQAAVADKIQTQDSSLDVRGRDPETGENISLFTIAEQNVASAFEVDETDIQALLKKQGAWLWPAFIWGSHEYTLPYNVVVDSDRLAEILNTQDALLKKNMKKPQDAYLEGYSEEEQKFILVPEVLGNWLDTDLVQQVIYEAIHQGDSTVDLEAQGCYLEPSVTVEDAALQENLTQAEKWLGTEITYDWNGNSVLLDREQIKDWIILEDGKPTLDEEAVAEFVKANAKEYDTYGKTRTFHTTLGYDLSLPSGAFGWLTDREAETEALIALIKEGAVEDREPEYSSEGAAKGTDDIGDTYVEVDMTNQHLYLYQNGAVELESDFVSGNMSKGYNTPAGVFGLTYKTKNAVLRGADYATPVNYWMPFNGNVGMHDATWRSSFGGNIYLTSGSHGCINLPLDKAKEIYQYMSENFPIICYYYPEGMLEPVSSETPETEQAAEEQSTTEQPTEEQTTTEQSTTEQGSTE